MPWNGSGTYSLPPAYSPEVNGTIIDAVRYNGLTSDVAAGITNSLAKDGQNVPTANLPMGGFKHSGAADANAAGQYIVYGQTTLANLGGNLSVTGLLFLSLGAVGTPSYSFSGDTNTGMWSPAADVIAWSVGGVEGARLNSSGFGLGTTPAVRLDVATTVAEAFRINGTNAAGVFSRWSNSGIDFGYIGNGTSVNGTTNSFIVLAATGKSLILGSNTDPANNFISLSTAGNVGIGANSAGPRLFVQKNNTDLAEFNSTHANGGWIAVTRSGTRHGFFGNSAALYGGSTSDTTVRSEGALQLVVNDSGIPSVGLQITTDRRVFGLALHNNAGLVTGTVNQYIASGTYTPTLANVANCVTLTSAVCSWLRVGNVVTVSGSINIGCTTAANTASSFTLTLPIASNIAAVSDLGGVGARDGSGTREAVNLQGSIAGDVAVASFNCTITTTSLLPFTFTYVIL